MENIAGRVFEEIRRKFSERISGEIFVRIYERISEIVHGLFSRGILRENSIKICSEISVAYLVNFLNEFTEECLKQSIQENLHKVRHVKKAIFNPLLHFLYETSDNFERLVILCQLHHPPPRSLTKFIDIHQDLHKDFLRNFVKDFVELFSESNLLVDDFGFSKRIYAAVVEAIHERFAEVKYYLLRIFKILCERIPWRI